MGPLAWISGTHYAGTDGCTNASSIGATVHVVAESFSGCGVPSSLALLLVGRTLGSHTAGRWGDALYQRDREFGIVFCLFTIGSELYPLADLRMRHSILGWTAQVAL